MALLTKQAIGLPGADLTMSACAGGGDTVAVDRAGIRLIFRNGDGTSKTVTLVDPRTQYGQASPDVPLVVAAGAIREIPVPLEFADSTGILTVTYSGVTSCTIAAVYG